MPENESEKIQINIYQIDKNLFEDTDTSEDIVQKIIDSANQDKSESTEYKLQSLISEEKEGFNIKVLYSKAPSNPKWRSFLNTVVNDGEAVLTQFGSTLSWVAFLWDEDNIYATCAGFGFFEIQEWINNEFGIEIISRLINKDDRVLKSITDKGLAGPTVGTSKHFRGNYSFFDEEGFGKIYQQVQSVLTKEVLINKFGFSNDELSKDSACFAKTSFRINKSISFDELIRIVGKINGILEQDANFKLNKVELLIKKRNKALIINLEKKLLEQLWSRYSQVEGAFDFDLCHKDFEKYLTASSYEIRKNFSKNNFFESDKTFDSLTDIEDVFEEIRNSGDNVPQNFEDFEKIINSLKIYSFNGDQISTKGWILHHLYGDLDYEEKKYFYVDNKWYRIDSDFIETLNEDCKFLIEHNLRNDLLDHKWTGLTIGRQEFSYNQKYLGETGLFVLDTITPKNIEPCDILKIDGDDMYFIHVKKGFNNSMRDLCSQVFISARIFDEMMRTNNYEYLDLLYQQVQNSSDARVSEQLSGVSLEDFKNKFARKNFKFVIAIVDERESDRDLINIENFHSNIAKFSLWELHRKIRSLMGNSELIITQIKRS